MYGKISYSGTSKDSVTVEITIKIENPEYEESYEIFDMITVNHVISKKTLNVKTVISENLSSSNKFSVTYAIKGPSAQNILFNNQFGDIDIKDFTGNADITLDHGNLSVNASFSKLKLKIKDGKTVLPEIDIVNAILSNSQLTLKKTHNVEINADYSSIKIESAGTINLKGQTNEVDFKHVNDISIVGSHCFVKCANISQKGFFEIQNGALTIDKIKSSADNISAAVSDTPVKIALETGLSHTLHGEISNGNLFHPDKEKLRIIKDGEILSFGGEIDNQNVNKKITEFILFSENGDIIIEYAD
jgi:hypothetical protein